jgi:signal transduction histidine kinase
LATTDPQATVHEQAEPAPIVQLVEVSADNQSIDVGGATVGPGPRQIQFRYSGIHLSAPGRVRYEYMLEGLDREWISAAARRTVTYSRVPDGHYRFRVRASVPGQQPSEAAMGLEVLPHFYQRAYFLWFCFTLLLAGAYGIYQMHLRQIRHRFALVLDERARIAREIHDTLMQGFVGISAQLAVALELSGHEEIVLKHIAVARKMARHSLTEAKRSMQDLRSPGLEEVDLPSTLSHGAARWGFGRSTPVEVEILGSPRKLNQDLAQNLLRIAQEAVTNALHHANAAKISIRLQFAERSLRCPSETTDEASIRPALCHRPKDTSDCRACANVPNVSGDTWTW